ncbi:MAG: DUF4430 domain-containing protein [Planctomycetota bacterium]|nr:MAG: DUF4430 domain-containing protein [Planctomycetota bacterium]REJ92735.1 MAG: DUF4430 domain-containing protein [Planctomycetota bacterium]REK23773.1 MAG: DUF4430 domain-containing protein [Planctomycetota bacterium]REK47626.1 MAG: DUF4430 domain-containing protein [Planctomycetota bacterium]
MAWIRTTSIGPSRARLAVSLVILVTGAWGCDASPPVQPQKPASGTVQLSVEFGGAGNDRRLELPWKSEMTVFGVLESAAALPDGIRFEHRGHGETVFVSAIDGVANQGGGENARNWIFKVNDTKSNVSAGVAKVAADDHVLWKFTSEVE